MWCNVRICVWNLDMHRVLVVYEIGLGMARVPVPVAVICKFLTEKVIVG